MKVTKHFTWLGCLLLALLLSGSQQPASADERLRQLLTDFAQKYRALNMPGVTLSYVDLLQRIQNEQGLAQQQQLFEQTGKAAQSIDPKQLSVQNKRFYKQLLYEIDLNLRRIALEQKYRQTATQAPTADGILYQPLGKQFYLYWLHYYLSLPVSPEALKAFGMQEVRKVQQQLRELRRQTGYAHDSAGFYAHLNNSDFILTRQADIIKLYKQKYAIVKQHLPRLFRTTVFEELAFAPIPNADKDSPPGIYADINNTFQFNFYGEQHNSRAMDFLLLHEGVPGHHYQAELRRMVRGQNPLGNLFWYFAYAEGWAAYTEELGQELGLYQTVYDKIGKLEWELVRSARVVMDVGINYEGWTNEQALKFWKANIPNQDAIAQREIDRMRRWPVQVLTYKVGADFILRKLAHEKQKQGKTFDIRQFHEEYLRSGPMPLAILWNDAQD